MSNAFEISIATYQVGGETHYNIIVTCGRQSAAWYGASNYGAVMLMVTDWMSNQIHHGN